MYLTIKPYSVTAHPRESDFTACATHTIDFWGVQSPQKVDGTKTEILEEEKTMQTLEQSV